MANTLFDPGRASFLKKEIDWINDDIRAILLDTAQYTFSAAHQYLSSVPGAARIAIVALSSKTALSDGSADAADPTFLAVAAGKTVGAFLLYLNTGSDATARLIAYFDTGTNLPVATNGGDITVAFNAAGVFKL